MNCATLVLESRIPTLLSLLFRQFPKTVAIHADKSKKDAVVQLLKHAHECVELSKYAHGMYAKLLPLTRV